MSYFTIVQAVDRNANHSPVSEMKSCIVEYKIFLNYKKIVREAKVCMSDV